MDLNFQYGVSVRLMTYNHAKFIREAMNGIMKQKANFKIEVVVGDDFSQDDTLAIVKEFQSTDKIHINVLERHVGDDYWQRRQKLGRLYNFTNILDNCKGKYIALLDGDDFWVDPLKLQKQFDFLEDNSDYVGCYHDVKVVDETGRLVMKSKNSTFTTHDFSADDLMKGRVMSVLSLCFRNVIKEYPPEMYQVMLADKFLCALLGQHGKGRYLKNIEPAAYRLHSEGVWSLKSQQQKKMGLITSYFWMWKYYERNKKTEYAIFFFTMIMREGFFSNPFEDQQSTLFDRLEFLIIKTLRKIFALIRRLLSVRAVKKQN